MPEPIATWNSARGVWERPEANIICEHSALYSETWPTSGMTLGGSLYPLPTPAHRTDASASLSSDGLLGTLRSPDGICHDTVTSVRERWANGARHRGTLEESIAVLPTPQAAGARRGTDAQLGGQRASGAKRSDGLATALLKTPTAQLAVNGGSQHPDKRRNGGHGPTLADQVEHELLPGAAARDWKSGKSNIMDRNARPLNEVVEHLLPTPTAMDSRGARNATANRSAVKPATNNDGWTLCDVFWTGDSTRRQSPDGKVSLGAQLPGQLSLDELESA